MAQKTSIAWTDWTWSPVIGCSRVSPGCQHCYAERLVAVLMSRNPKLPMYHGLASVRASGEPQWSGEVRFLPERLAEPLSWRKPRKVFVCDMSDLFHDGVANEQIAAVFGVMAATPHITYQILTKRPERMARFFAWLDDEAKGSGAPPRAVRCGIAAANFGADVDYLGLPDAWPLPNLWVGTTVEDQKRANERIPHLLRVPARVRFLSCEPLLEQVDLDPPTCPTCGGHDEVIGDDDATGFCREHGDEMAFGTWLDPCADEKQAGINWVICGGESGADARTFDVEWARFMRHQCSMAGVSLFVKQLGARPVDSAMRVPENLHGLAQAPMALQLRDRAGGVPAEWPEDLRVQQFPEVRP